MSSKNDPGRIQKRVIPVEKLYVAGCDIRTTAKVYGTFSSSAAAAFVLIQLHRPAYKPFGILKSHDIAEKTKLRREIGLTKTMNQPTLKRLVKTLEFYGKLSGIEICKELGITARGTQTSLIQRAHKRHGIIYVKEYVKNERGAFVPLWALCPGEDAPKPAPQTKEERRESERLRKQAKRQRPKSVFDLGRIARNEQAAAERQSLNLGG